MLRQSPVILSILFVLIQTSVSQRDHALALLAPTVKFNTTFLVVGKFLKLKLKYTGLIRMNITPTIETMNPYMANIIQYLNITC